MPTLRERIADDVVALLSAGSPQVVPERSRTFSIEAAQTNSIIVYWSQDRIVPVGPMAYGASLVDRELEVIVEVGAKGTSSSRPDEEADALASWVEKKLAGQSKGVQAGSLYHSLQVRRVGPVQLEQADYSYALVPIEVVAKYQSRANDPETWA